MRFARIVFTVAGIWGIVITLPLYFLCRFVGKQSPPPINHLEFYYSFVGVTLAWQLAFLLIGRDPCRYRMMMIPSILEKFSYVVANLILFFLHDISVSQALPSTTDLVLAILFITAWMKTRSTLEAVPVS